MNDTNSLPQLPPIPYHQRSLHDAGIHTARLDVHYSPEPPFLHLGYGFAFLTLSGKWPHHSREEATLILRFQRHVLRPDDDLSQASISDPRFDYGPTPWSAFYSPNIVAPPMPLTEARRLAQMTRAAVAIDGLMRSSQLASALRVTPIDCQLAIYLAALESQGIPVATFHNLVGGEWPEQEVLENPQRFQHGTAAAFRRRHHREVVAEAS